MNKLTKETILIKELIGGASLSIPVYTLEGKKDGPTVYIQASLHGGEIQGNAVILDLIEKLSHEDLSGKILFVPLSNPYATNHKISRYTMGRFNPNTGDNWNRNFVNIFEKMEINLDSFCKQNMDESESKIRARFQQFLSEQIGDYIENQKQHNKLHDNNKLNLILQAFASKADIVLDLHTGPTATEYIYCSKRSLEELHYLDFSNALIIDNTFAGAMDEATFMPWVYLEKAFHSKGRDIHFDFHSFTIELESEEGFCMELGKAQSVKILNYLRSKKVISGNAKRTKIDCASISNFDTIYAAVSGLIDYKIPVGKHFKRNDVLGIVYQFHNIDNKDFSKNQFEIKAHEDGILVNRCPSSAIQEGMELFQVMVHTYERQ